MKRVLLRLWYVMACMSLMLPAMAQSPSTYTFTSVAGTYNNITGTAVTSIQTDEVLSAALPIGFTFNFAGSPYTQFKVSSNGFLTFNTGSTSANLTNAATSLVTSQPMLMPLWDDMNGNLGTALYATTGTAPNRVLTMEWRNWRWNWQATGATISFQLRMYETTNVIEYQYRQESGTPNATSATIGIGSVNTVNFGYMTLDNIGGTPTASASVFNTAIAVKPPNGQIYRFTPPPPCTAAPSGITVNNPGTVCPNLAFTLTLNGVPSVSGLAYQWQSSPNGTTWTNITGATGTTLTTSVPSSTYFRCVVTCTAVTASFNTPGVQVNTTTPTVLPYSEGFEGISTNNELPACWRSTNNGTITQTYTAPQTSNNRVPRTGSKFAAFRWSAVDTFYTQGISMTAGSTYSVSLWYITDGMNGYGPLTLGYGRSPRKDSMTSFVSIPANITNNTYQQLSGTFVAPVTGTYYISIACSITGAPWYLSFDDLNVKELATCTAAPNGGTTASSQDSVCTGQSFTLSITGAPTYLNGSYQWQYSTNGTTWVDIPGAVTDAYTLTQTQNTYYRCKVTCNASGQVANSAQKFITMKSYLNCYCTPTFSFNCSTLGSIKDFVLNGINNTSINDLNTGCSSPAVRFVSPQPYVQLLRGGSHTGSISSDYTSTMNAKIWVDFNRDGIFDSNYELLSQFGNAQNTAFNLTIPFFVDTGVYRMRVRSVYSTNVFTSCDNQNYGETHDYWVNIRPCANPPVNLGPDAVLCSGASTTLNAGVYQGATYSWSTGATTPTISVNTGGQYRVTVSVPGGCVSRDTIVITTGTLPTLTVSNDTTVCLGASVTFNAATTGGQLYWSTGATTPSITVNQAGAYVVTSTSPQNCIVRDTVNLTYSNNAIVILGPDIYECPNVPVTLNAGNPGSTYLWNNGATTQTVAVLNAGQYDVLVKTQIGCEGRDTINVFHKPLPEAAFTYEVDGTVVSFMDTSSDASSHQWFFGDGQSSTQLNPVHTYVQYGTYAVTMVATNPCGRDTARTILGLYPTGLREQTKNLGLLLYPNPSEGTLFIDNKPGLDIKEVRITNMLGAVVYEQTALGKQALISLNLHQLANGTYNMYVETDKGHTLQTIQVLKK